MSDFVLSIYPNGVGLLSFKTSSDSGDAVFGRARVSRTRYSRTASWWRLRLHLGRGAPLIGQPLIVGLGQRVEVWGILCGGWGCSYISIYMVSYTQVRIGSSTGSVWFDSYEYIAPHQQVGIASLQCQLAMPLYVYPHPHRRPINEHKQAPLPRTTYNPNPHPPSPTPSSPHTPPAAHHSP